MDRIRENLIICDHPLISHKLSILRCKHTDKTEFRTTMHEIAMLIGYEAMRDLELRYIDIETPIKTASCPVINGNEPVIVPILRAGVGMSEGLIKLIPNALIGLVGISRDKETLKTTEYLCKLPSNLDNRKIYVMDPMLATGSSAIAAIDSIKRRGGRDITFLCVIAAPNGIDTLLSAHPDIKLVVGNVDNDVNERAFVSPGFGNAGDRYFGTE